MSLPYRVNLQGFSTFERSALASYFRLAASRTPSYEQADSAADARFLIVDADHPDAVRTVVALGRVADSVFIGAQPPEGASAWMMRPIDPLHVLRELDAMVGATAPPQLPSREPAPGPHGGPVPARRAADQPGFVAVSMPAVPAAPATPRPSALVVDDSEIAQRFLASKLERWGLAVERATTSARAIELMSQRSYDFVFLDVELGVGSELDGLALCLHIKRLHRRPGVDMPVIALVSAHHAEIDRVRGTLAGADAYLGKPLDDAALARLMKAHGVKAPPVETDDLY
jgi:CheY-like chemotaxis protein